MSTITAKCLEDPKHSAERELTRQLHEEKISRKDFRDQFEAISGWFVCSKCRWEGPYAPMDFSKKPRRAYCPECETFFE